ncbi:MAG: TetR/AcrR family transcriptional regulator [Paracoccus sp. (in: a-proteobacteria)]|uniref:TetR/AcrR family transcriptional regulator n=1 Tax=Paracoccus sp. TaxID=267 RepID=UPI00405980CF
MKSGGGLWAAATHKGWLPGVRMKGLLQCHSIARHIASSKSEAKSLVGVERVFEEHGFRGLGVDGILGPSRASTRTLYKHFGSRDGLVLAVLANAIEPSWAVLMASRAMIPSHNSSPERQWTSCCRSACRCGGSWAARSSLVASWRGGCRNRLGLGELRLTAGSARARPGAGAGSSTCYGSGLGNPPRLNGARP